MISNTNLISMSEYISFKKEEDQLFIQIYSDIHIEINRILPNIKPLAKYLFLAGNICMLNHPLFFKFLDYCSPLWTKIFYTPGNHEFYSNKSNYNALDFEYDLKIKSRYKNIFYLNRKAVPLNDNIDVYGSVFWTNELNISDSYIDNDSRSINQFSEIKKHNIPIDKKFIKCLSNDDFTHLSGYLNSTNKSKKIIIITHFPPTQDGTMSVNQTQEFKNYNAWNNILDPLNLTNVIAWISGHTHWSYNLTYEQNEASVLESREKINNYPFMNNKKVKLSNNIIKLLSNQIGYKNEFGLTGFSEQGLFDIKFK